MTNPERFRPNSTLIMGWISIVFFAGFTGQAIFFAGINEILITGALSSVGLFGAYLCFLKPYVIIFDEGIKIVNPTKEIIASWDRIDEIETKYSMSIIIDERTFYAWAAPAPGRHHFKTLHKSDFTTSGSNLPIRLGDSPRSDSGACAHIARLRRRDFIADNHAALNIFEIKHSIFTN